MSTKKRKVLIAPSILSCDFANFKDDIIAADNAGIDMFHFDVMDGCYVNNLSFGTPILKTLRKITNKNIDVHFMVYCLENILDIFLEYGADRLIFHPKTLKNPMSVIKKIKDKGCSVGIAINPDEKITDYYHLLDKIDIILLMSVFPGFSGQKFITSTLHKIEEIRSMIAEKQLKLEIEIDGGINLNNISSIANMGANTIVMGSSFFDTSKEGKQNQDIYSNIVNTIHNLT